MARTWVTNASTTVEAVVNSLNAACDRGYVPDHVAILGNPTVESQVADAIERVETIVAAYGGEPPAVERSSIEDETAFDRIQAHHVEAIAAARERGDAVAVDITPGRKYMSAIAFAVGMRHGADHVFYFYLASSDFHGRLYPEIPRTAVTLVDFAEAD